MRSRSHLSTLAISFALLGLVAWMATAHPAGGRLYADSAVHARIAAQTATQSR
jgi:hypothetical protein